jgi:DNA-binding LacI/PurR family transcriptional regulator
VASFLEAQNLIIMTTRRPATIKEIAKRLKISTSTVSRALKDHPSIGLVTTMRVKKVAEELNYEPNQTAIFFKQRRTFTIGVVLPSLSEPFFASAISEIEEIAAQNQYTVIMGQSLNDPERESNILQTLKNHRVDGILMSVGKNTVDFSFIESLQRAEIPIVFFDCVPDMDGLPKVTCNLESGMLEAISLFASCGHHNIALINGPALLPASIQRRNAFIKGLQEHGIPFREECIVQTDLTPLGNQEAIMQLIQLADRPSAVVSFNDYVTLDVMKVVRQRGLVLNQDIHFISFANYPLWQYMENPPMARIEQFPDLQGKTAATLLFSQLLTPQDDIPLQTVFPSRLMTN